MAVPLNVVIMFLISIILQVSALALLPLTKGFSNIIYSSLCSILFLIGIACLARIVSTGVQLSILIPLSAASVPIAIIGIALIFYGEPARRP